MVWERAETGALAVVGSHQAPFQVGGKQWDQQSDRSCQDAREPCCSAQGMRPGGFAALLFKLRTPNRAFGVVMALRGSRVPCQMLEGTESLWTGSRGDPEGRASLSEQAAAVPRQWNAPEVSSEPSPGNPANTQGEGGESLGLLQHQRSLRARASLPRASATLNAIQKISTSSFALGKKTLQVGVVSHVGMLLFRLSCSRARLLRLPLRGWAGRSLPPSFHGGGEKPEQSRSSCLASPGVQEWCDTPQNTMLLLGFEASPTNLVWGPSCSLAWPRGLDYFHPGLIMRLILIADS